MEENRPISDQTAQQMLELFQQWTLSHSRLIPPEHILRLQTQLEKSEHGSYDRLTNFPLMVRIFTILVQRKNLPTMSELGTELDAPLSSVTRLVDWLVRANLIERVDDPEDRRIVRVRLTQNGVQIYQDGTDYYKKWFLKFLMIYTPQEQEQLLNLMHKFVNTFIT